MEVFFSKKIGQLSGQRLIEELIEVCYLAIVFLIPLWFAYFFPTYHIFELNKICLFQVLVCLLLFFTAVKLVFYSSYQSLSPRAFFKKYWLIPTIFISGLGLSLLFSENPILSFYGSLERQAGLTNYLFYFLWFILLSFNLTFSLDSWQNKVKRLIITIISSATLVGLYGILQILSIDFIVWPNSFLNNRAMSSFGQPNFLASWLLLVLPLSLYSLFTSKKFLIKFFYLLVLLIQFIALIFTGSRGGMIALIGALILFLIYWLSQRSWSRSRKILMVIFSLFICSLLLIVFNSVSGGRLQEWRNLNYGSLGIRVQLIKAAQQGISARPWLGYGLESGRNIFIEYYQPEWGAYESVGATADRAHNIILDILLANGIYGLLLFIGLYYFFFKLALRNIRYYFSKSLSVALIFGWSAYLFSLLFSFTTVTGEIYFWLFLAILVAINAKQQPEMIRTSSPEIIKPTRLNLVVRFGLVVIIGGLMFGLINRSLKMIIADYYFNQALIALVERDYAVVVKINSYWREQKINPISQTAYGLFLGDKLCDLYPFITDKSSQKIIKDELLLIDQISPGSSAYGLLVKAKISTALNNPIVARKYFDSLIMITPYWPLVHLSLGNLLMVSGDFPAALISYDSTLVNLPPLNDPRLNEEHRQLVLGYHYFINQRKAEIYFAQKDYTAARHYYQLAYGNNLADYTLLKKIADTYYLQGDIPQAIVYNQRGWQRSPQDYNWLVALANLYYEAHDLKQAIKCLDQAIELAPERAEFKNLKIKMLTD